jgi:hypothetical protein
MQIWRRVGLTLTMMVTALVFVLWRRVLPFPFFAMLALFFASNYFVGVRKIGYRQAPFVIAMVAIPLGCFVYGTSNSVNFWITAMLAMVGGVGLAYLVFNFNTRKPRITHG